MSRVTARRRVSRFADGRVVERDDTLAAEEPLEIRIAGRPIAVTMRTPGDDFDLVAGFLWTEGLLTDPGDLTSMRYCESGPVSYNVVDAALGPAVPAAQPTSSRAFYTTSSCGVCGKASIDAIRIRARFPVADDPIRLSPQLLAVLPDRLRAAQRVFQQTGGLHAAGLFDPDGGLECLREDVGRHNAVDKVVGWALRARRLPLTGRLLLVSGRASFELVQKAVLAGIPALAAVSAPSTLAVELAEEAGLTLVGFLRGPTLNVYARSDRLASGGAAATAPPAPASRQPAR
jgi:FdhD protein